MSEQIDNDPGRLRPGAQLSPAIQSNSAAGQLVLPHDPTEPALSDYETARRGSFDADVPIYRPSSGGDK